MEVVERSNTAYERVPETAPTKLFGDFRVTRKDLGSKKPTIFTIFVLENVWSAKSGTSAAGDSVALERCYRMVSIRVLQEWVSRNLQFTKTAFSHAIFLGEKSAKVIQPRQISNRSN